MDWTTIGIGITTAIILFFQLIVFGRQASRLSDTIKCTQKAERPYIFAEPVGYSMLKGDELAKWKCDYIVKNHGKTPAIIISKVVYIWLIADGDYPPYEIIQGKDIPEGGGVIGSGDHRPFICGPKKIDITVAQNIENGLEIGKLFCVGRIDYKDIFGEKHFTEFEWVFKNDTINPKGFYLTPNEKRNRYT